MNKTKLTLTAMAAVYTVLYLSSYCAVFIFIQRRIYLYTVPYLSLYSSVIIFVLCRIYPYTVLYLSLYCAVFIFISRLESYVNCHNISFCFYISVAQCGLKLFLKIIVEV